MALVVVLLSPFCNRHDLNYCTTKSSWEGYGLNDCTTKPSWEGYDLSDCTTKSPWEGYDLYDCITKSGGYVKTRNYCHPFTYTYIY